MNRTTLLNSLRIHKINPHVDCETIERLNSSAGVSTDRLFTDYGQLKQCDQPFWLFAPKTVSEAINGLNAAVHVVGMNIRVRGAGHSMNGSTLPKQNELLFSSLGLRSLRRISNHSIEVGSGAQVWVIDDFLKQYGCYLPVVNDGGGPAPTVGGFFCAGGFGVNSRDHGGFWNHVESLRIWSKTFGEKIIYPDDEYFWTLAAAGNIANTVILTARLKICGTLHHDIDQDLDFIHYHHPRHLWFTFITTAGKSAKLYQELARLNRKLKDYWSPLAPYSYHIKTFGQHRALNFHPSTHSDLIAAGVWGTIKGVAGPDYSAILGHVDEALSRLPYSCRYWQSEL